MDNQYYASIGRRGGLARMKIYGNPGTPEGRRRGGFKSLESHAKNKTRFKTLGNIRIPRHSVRLAELIGIFMGDGHVGIYQATISTNSETDFRHAAYVKKLVEDIFHIQVGFGTRRDKKACVVVISSKAVCRYLAEQGIPQGNKIILGMRIPEWIRVNAGYRNAFVRGLFDTDGCVYVDAHVYKGKQYSHLGMAFANHSLLLLGFFKYALEDLGLHPTQKTKFRVFLRREKDIRRYFDLVGSSNEKHTKKFLEYVSRRNKGGVA